MAKGDGIKRLSIAFHGSQAIRDYIDKIYDEVNPTKDRRLPSKNSIMEDIALLGIEKHKEQLKRGNDGR